MPITWPIKNGNNNERFPFLETNNVKKKKAKKMWWKNDSTRKLLCIACIYSDGKLTLWRGNCKF